MNKKLPLVVKIIVFHLLFITLHYLYDWFPNGLTKVISGINESVYQHMKIGFFAYLIFALIEYLLIRRSISLDSGYLSARLFSATYLPMAMMAIYLFGPAIFGHIENMVFEVAYANVALAATSSTTFIVEQQLEQSKPRKMFNLIIIMLFLLSLFEFVIFTERLPWFDIFAVPPGY